MLVDNVQAQLELSLKNIGQKELLKEMMEFIKTTDFPRNTSKKFLISWLNNMKEQIK